MTENLEKIIEQAFLDYSAFVLQRRAIPDARDMFKYTARQIIHAQSREKLDHKHPFKKSQKSTAAATGFSYVHGGTSAYEQIIRMGRPLVQRYFLEEINGNGGTPTGSSTYSAERYTEARLSELSDYILTYLNMNTIDDKDWEPTYDEEGIFPKVFPSVGYYNICNGSFGSIGVGLISSIPQFNLREVNKAICELIDNPNAQITLLPDFASGGILLNPKTVESSLAIGEGKSALLRGKIRKNEKEGYLEIIEVPYGVYTNTICVELEKALNSDGNDVPFTSFKDLSKKTVQIRIESKKLDKLEEWLYKNTSVQKHFTIKLIVLDNGKTPKLFSITNMLKAHIDHSSLMFQRQYEYKLEQLKLREEIIRGLQKAHSILDDVIATVRASNGRTDVINNLVSKFDFTQRQAEAIAEVKTHRWSSLDIVSLQNELDENLIEQEKIENLLQNKLEFNAQLKKVYEEIASKFGDKRRTEISTLDKWESGQDGSKPTKDFWMFKTDEGYFTSYSDEIETKNKLVGFRIQPEDKIVLISNQARAFQRQGSALTIGEINWADIVKLNKNEEIISVMKQDELTQFEFIEFVTSDGDHYSLHQSFVLTSATQRGKKFANGKYDIADVTLSKTASKYPKMK